MKKRILAMIVTLMMLISGCGPVMGEAAGFPVQWDLSSVYLSAEEWQADYDRAEKLLDQFEDFRGRLNQADTIYEYYQFRYFGELTRLQGKLNTYAELGNYLDPTDPVFAQMVARMEALDVKEDQACAFVEPEIYELPLKKRIKIFTNPLFSDLQYSVQRFTDPDGYPFNEEENQLLAVLSIGEGYANKIYEILDSVELPDPVFTMPDGTERELTEQLYDEIVSDVNWDDEVKEQAYQAFLTRPVPLIHTIAMLLEENAAQAYANAQIDGFETTRESALAQNDLDSSVYDMLIQAAHDGAEDYQRYLRTHARGLDLQEQRPYHLDSYVSYFDPGWAEYEDAIEDVADSLEILGGEYRDTFMEIVGSGHVDVYPADTKAAGSFEIQPDVNALPWVLLNYEGYPEDISAIAHEMGHAVYDAWAAGNQNPLYASPPVFTQEIASVTNELLYHTYKLNRAATDAERLFYLEDLLAMFSDTFFTQAWYAEFEDYLYQTVEAGDALDAEALSDKWSELEHLYSGDEVKSYPENRYQWAVIPHFFYGYYVYQYAMDICYALRISSSILSGEEGAVDAYLDFLKKGASKSPVDLLKDLGIDPMSEEVYQNARTYYSGLVDEYERLVEK